MQQAREQTMNRHLAQLQPYPFEKLAQLKAGVTPPASLKHIALSIGEPQHQAPQFVKDAVAASLEGLAKYPITIGSLELRTAVSDWASKRFRLFPGLLNPEHNVCPVNGTREAIFSFVQCVVDPDESALVLMPNPFYQIYEGAALLAGAKPYYINATEATSLEPDYDSVPEEVWKRCKLLFVCSPGNPTGKVTRRETMAMLLEKAARYNFVIASDECYSEIYFDELAPPPGFLEVEAEVGNGKFDRCIVFHSLSKRSNLPGMRSGFVAGDAAIIEKYKLYRTYHGCAMPPAFQSGSVAAWNDEKHVIENRKLYREKFAKFIEILNPALPVDKPDAAFYLWLKTPISDEKFARELFERQNVTVVPGSYLSRESNGINPGANRVRLALVASVEECAEAANRIKSYVMENLK